MELKELQDLIKTIGEYENLTIWQKIRFAILTYVIGNDMTIIYGVNTKLYLKEGIICNPIVYLNKCHFVYGKKVKSGFIIGQSKKKLNL